MEKLLSLISTETVQERDTLPKENSVKAIATEQQEVNPY